MLSAYAYLHNAVRKKHITRQNENSRNMLTHTRLIKRDLMVSATVVIRKKRKSSLSLKVKIISEVFQMSPTVPKESFGGRIFF